MLTLLRYLYSKWWPDWSKSKLPSSQIYLQQANVGLVWIISTIKNYALEMDVVFNFKVEDSTLALLFYTLLEIYVLRCLPSTCSLITCLWICFGSKQCTLNRLAVRKTIHWNVNPPTPPHDNFIGYASIKHFRWFA